ncbi:hypothetical protein BCF33_0588 [Hasllibacter halocynthiae]|uniref:Uncharacterized protein n=1 Tax=Hasllibacter halocynthiae TaxID=595589 RepID=A0A2T0X7S7_9RHOB|nr:hypothetical protein [Hasllibacter halocynthiae]PRY94977.1 hypothetical protein BCF33_0588 [Hasllibacter halocynthiae]
MPLDRLVLILVIVIAAAGATVWLGALLVTAGMVPYGWLTLIPVGLVAYLLWRVVSDRLSEKGGYDRIEK